MKRDWRHNEVQLLTQVKELLGRLKGELLPDFAIGAGARVDFRLKTDNAAYIVEIKGASAGDYLSFATWGQMTMYKKVIESWHKPDSPEVVPILVTNAVVSDDLRAAFEKSRIAVVEVEIGEDLTHTQQKLERVLEDLGLPVPEVKVSSAS